MQITRAEDQHGTRHIFALMKFYTRRKTTNLLRKKNGETQNGKTHVAMFSAMTTTLIDALVPFLPIKGLAPKDIHICACAE